MHKFECDYFGKYYSPMISQVEKFIGYQNNFFYFGITEKGVEWSLRMYINAGACSCEPYKFEVPEHKKRFSLFQCVKVFTNDKKWCISELEFFKRYNNKRALMNRPIFERFRDEYKTVLNWLCISFNGKELFWENLKRDHENNKLKCYKARLQENINTFTDND
jgi:hypothetical protein